MPESRSLKPSESVLSVPPDSEFCAEPSVLSVDALLLVDESSEEEAAPFAEEVPVEEDEESKSSSIPELSKFAE